MPHPLYDAVLDVWLASQRLDPRWVRAMMAGEIPVSRAFAEAMYRAMGVPLDAWKLEPDLRNLGRPAKLTEMQEPSPVAAPPVAPRRGRKLTSQGPMGMAVQNAGLDSMLALGRVLGAELNRRAAAESRKPVVRLPIPNSTLWNWDRERNPPDEVRAALAEAPFSVPISSWVARTYKK